MVRTMGGVQPAAVGDRVQVHPAHDETLRLMGQRTSAGTITALYDDSDDPTAVVELDDGQGVPYPLSELAILQPRAGDQCSARGCEHPRGRHGAEGCQDCACGRPPRGIR